MLRIEEILDKRHKMCYNFYRNGAKTPKENTMKGYIIRLEKDIEKIRFKKGRLDDFFARRAFTECDGKQAELLKKQSDIMEQLIAVMQERLQYELNLHPQIEEVDDADDCDDGEEFIE